MTDNQEKLARLLMDTVAKSMGIPPHRLTMRTQDPAVSRARKVAMVIVHQQSGLTRLQTAKLFGRTQSASVLHACAQVQQWIRTELDFRGPFLLVIEDVKRAMKRAEDMGILTTNKETISQ